MIRVLLCDDQQIVCEGLQAILRTAKGIEVVGMAHDGAEALEMVEQRQPDVVLMDLKMPIMNGIQATSQMAARFPQVKVLVLTTYASDEWVFDAIRAGASGYLLKDTPKDGIVAAITGTVSGQTHVDPHVAGKLFKQISSGSDVVADTAVLASLTERERDVLTLLGRGLSNSDIADQLYLSEGTVRNYVSRIFAKLDVTDRTQAALIALRHGSGD